MAGIVATLLGEDGEGRSWHSKSTSGKISDLDTFLDWLRSGGETSAGANVTETTALSFGAVFACVKVISEDEAKLPLIVYKRLVGGGKERDPRHRLYDLLHTQPNAEMTAMEYRELIVSHLLLWGNAYSEIERNQIGEVKALWPLRPDRMEMYRDPDKRNLIYRYTLPDNTYAYFRRDEHDSAGNIVRRGNMWHLKGLSGEGHVGYSPIRKHREAIGLGMAAQEYGSRFFSNDSSPGGLLIHPDNPDEKKTKLIKASWEEGHAGLSNKHRVAVLGEGMKWQQIGIPPVDSQFIETRKLSIIDIARIYRIPPHKIMDLERGTFSNIEHQAIEYVVDCLTPWLVRIEQSIWVHLMDRRDRLHHFAEHLVEGLLRGDTKTRYEAYAVGRQNGWLNGDEIRELENRNPIEDGSGKIYWMPANMLPANVSISEPVESKETPPVEEEEEEEGEERIVRPRQIVMGFASLHAERSRIRIGYRRLIEDAAKRLLSKETIQISKIIKKTLKEGDIDGFLRNMDEIYERFGEDSRKILLPTLVSYAEQIQAACLGEMGLAQTSSSRASPVYCTCEEKEVGLETLMDHYQGTYDERHVSFSSGTLRKIVERLSGTTPDEIAAEVERTLDDWMVSRPSKIAIREVVKTDGLVARSTFFAEGRATVAWIAAENESVFCKALDGKKVRKNEPFLRAGETLNPEGASSPLTARNHRYHPPLLSGCECYVGIKR